MISRRIMRRINRCNYCLVLLMIFLLFWVFLPSPNIVQAAVATSPSNLIADVVSATKIQLTWQDNSNTLEIINSTPYAFINLNLSNPLPSELDFLSASDGGVNNDNNILWSFSGLSPNTEKSVTYTAKVL